jgi:hypothetical protein
MINRFQVLLSISTCAVFESRNESACIQRLKGTYDTPLSSFAFNFNLRRYKQEDWRTSYINAIRSVLAFSAGAVADIDIARHDTTRYFRVHRLQIKTR